MCSNVGNSCSDSLAAAACVRSAMRREGRHAVRPSSQQHTPHAPSAAARARESRAWIVVVLHMRPHLSVQAYSARPLQRCAMLRVRQRHSALRLVLGARSVRARYARGVTARLKPPRGGRYGTYGTCYKCVLRLCNSHQGVRPPPSTPGRQPCAARRVGRACQAL